jgi:Holliday junction resolvase
MREATIEDSVIVAARKAGWFVRRVAWRGRKDCPDAVFAKLGRVVWIEFKREGEQARVTQKIEHEEMRAAGMEVYVVDSIAVGKRVLGLS